MATSTVAGAMKMVTRMVALASVFSVASAQFATTVPMPDIPDWQVKSEMILSVTALDGGIVPIQFTVAPLTANLGLNQTDAVRNIVLIQGSMQLADMTNYNAINDSNTIAYLCCDTNSQDQSYITPSLMLNTLMSNRPRSIILYSMIGNCCGLQGSNLPYSSIFTMTDREEAVKAWNLTSMGAGQLRATITGNVSSTIASDSTTNATNGSNSAVAMSILYSITGLITLLFLVIIATGAIRAHRYPERYGPRSGYGGQPRQSRAKGIARAVLETLPIIKFSGPEQHAKPDPAIELEQGGAAADGLPERPSQAHLSTIREEPETPRRNGPPGGGVASSASAAAGVKSVASSSASVATAASPTAPSAPPPSYEHGIGPDRQGHDTDHGAHSNGGSELGCSICTEDFKVGEDVRVLPCNHKFHPACVDPWLINVSGTCPLCRLDLRPQNEKRDPSMPDQLLPPPLELDQADGSGAGPSSRQQRRGSRFLDLHRLRHASVEERIEGLRRYRTETRESEAAPDVEDRTRRARLSERLRERFRIRTRAQSPEHMDNPAASASSFGSSS